MSELYNKIAALCAEKGITVTELCRQCKISRASLSDLKVGRKKNLSTKNLSKIADYLRERFGVTGTVQDVMDGINEVMEESYFPA